VLNPDSDIAYARPRSYPESEQSDRAIRDCNPPPE
jgi:hypothetical protein